MASGLTLGQFARRMHYSTGYLSKIENGHKPPGEDLARRCDAALGANGALLALLPRPRPRGPSPTNGRTTVGGQNGVALEEAGLAWLWPAGPWPAGSDRDMAGSPAVAGGRLGPDHLGEPPGGLRAAADLDATITTFRAFFDHFRELGHQISPRLVLDLLVRHTSKVQMLAAAAREPEQHRRLTLLAARYAEYTGWMVQESGDEARAIQWTDMAAWLARSVGGIDLVQFALVRRADLALYRDDAAQTVELARRAQADPTVAPRVLGLAAQREAQGHALANDYAAYMRALDRSATLLAAGPGNEGSDGNPAVGSTSLAGQIDLVAGWALYDLGRPAEAARILDVEVPRMPALAARSRARFGVRHALAHAAAGELEQACALATDLLPVVERADSATIRLDLARLARHLRRWHGDPRVRELFPALTSALRTQPD